MKKVKKKNFMKNRLTSDRQVKTDLDKKKEMLHRLIDEITFIDYVEVNSRILDMAGKSQLIHQIFIEKNGNLLVNPRIKSFLDED